MVQNAPATKLDELTKTLFGLKWIGRGWKKLGGIKSLQVTPPLPSTIPVAKGLSKEALRWIVCSDPSHTPSLVSWASK